MIKIPARKCRVLPLFKEILDSNVDDENSRKKVQGTSPVESFKEMSTGGSVLTEPLQEKSTSTVAELDANSNIGEKVKEMSTGGKDGLEPKPLQENKYFHSGRAW